MAIKSKRNCQSMDCLLQRLRTRPVTAITLMSALFCFTVLHFALVCVLGRVKDVHGPLAADGALDDDGQVAPDGLWHGDEDAGVVEVLLVLWPAFAFLITLLRTGTLLQWQTGQEEKETCQENEADAAGVQCCVGTAVRRQSAVARRGDCDDVDGWNFVLAKEFVRTQYSKYTYRLVS